MNRDLDELIAQTFNLAGLPRSGVWWTPQRASKAADVVTGTYTNMHTQVYYLSKLRTYLKSVNASPETIQATKRRDITIARNAGAPERLKAKTDKGIEVPEAFKSVERLCERIEAFIAKPEATAEALADFLVTFSARKHEALSLRLKGDKLTGALKQRGVDDSFDIVSAVPVELCKRFITAWGTLAPEDIQRAIRRLDRSCQKVYGCSVRNLREVGAFLASRQGDNEGSKLDTMKRALRHKRTNMTATVEHYQAVRDPNSDIMKALADVDPDEHDEILKFIKRRKVQ